MTKYIPYVQMVLVLLILGLTGRADNNDMSMGAWAISAIALGAVIYVLQCVYNAYHVERTARHVRRSTRRTAKPVYEDTRRAA